ncbi:MAG TPA: hypothetical protein VJC21_05810 [Candidatus Nanoarchaeia archaeon]|nr:hypothetical protein [Candidatus Nanoarchaeia archaeon]
MLDIGTCLRHYKRREIQEALVAHAQDREIGMRFQEMFGKRPDILSYPRDVLELALRNATSFHASEERWSNPLALSSTLSKRELEELRSGWDLVLDIDCKIFEYSRICADLVVKFLRYCGVDKTALSAKFSGNKGFHIGVPFEAFPASVNDIPMVQLFPEAPRKIAAYVKENIQKELGKRILAYEKNNFAAVKEKVGLAEAELLAFERNAFGDSVPSLSVEKFLEIDTVLLASRHLYRMPYSLHEKSGLASVPVEPENVLQFEKAMAKPEQVKAPLFHFLSRNVSGETARRLLLQALDFKTKVAEEREKPAMKAAYDEIQITSAIREEFFPPCMKLINKGLADGKKRGLFSLINFLGKIGWAQKEIVDYTTAWNAKNPEPLREVYLKGQLAHFIPGQRLPPNCDNEAYCKGIGVCQPDSFCSRIKNPVNYTILKWRRVQEEKQEAEEKKRERKEEKEENIRERKTEKEKQEENKKKRNSPENTTENVESAPRNSDSQEES